MKTFDLCTDSKYCFLQPFIFHKIVTQEEPALRKDFHLCTLKIGILTNKILTDLPFFLIS